VPDHDDHRDRHVCGTLADVGGVFSTGRPATSSRTTTATTARSASRHRHQPHDVQVAVEETTWGAVKTNYRDED